MFYARTTIDAVEGRTQPAKVLVMQRQPRRPRRTIRRTCKVLRFARLEHRPGVGRLITLSPKV
jgi:hypothetical protein